MNNDHQSERKSAERILDEAWQLFQQKGYRGVTMDELCLRCGLTKPTLYYYFQDKENLFVQVLRHQLHGFYEVIMQTGTLEERLQRIATRVLDNFQVEYTALMRDREHLHNPKNIQSIRESFRGELFDPLKALMLTGIEERRLKADSPEILTLVFLGIINNFIHRSNEMELSNAELAEKLVQYFLKGAEIHE